MQKTYALLFVLCLVLTGPARAANDTPDLPPALETLAGQGAQLRYLGNEYGLDGWIAIYQGQEQYFYVTPDGKAMVSGLMMDRNGRMITIDQIRRLRQETGGTLDIFAEDMSSEDSAAVPGESFPEKVSDLTFKTPAEQLFENIEDSNWIPLGDPAAPVIYSFVDPQCPHCRAFMQDLHHDYIDKNAVQVRIIPVGRNPDSLKQAAFLLALPNPQERWWRHVEGDAGALPVSGDISQKGVAHNMAVMRAWKLDTTPLTIYRAKDGQVKIVEGRARNIDQIVADLPSPVAP